VQFPAIALIVVGLLNVLGAGYLFFNGFVAGRTDPKSIDEMYTKMMPGLWEKMKKDGTTPEQIRDQGIVFAYGMGTAVLIVALITILGAVRMLALKSFGLSVLASIFAAAPCFSPLACCLVGLGAGIWSLVVLFSPDVREAFRR
jgi:uncharacterized membrane protein YuzA (DUF378 family)